MFNWLLSLISGRITYLVKIPVGLLHHFSLPSFPFYFRFLLHSFYLRRSTHRLLYFVSSTLSISVHLNLVLFFTRVTFSVTTFYPFQFTSILFSLCYTTVTFSVTMFHPTASTRVFHHEPVTSIRFILLLMFQNSPIGIWKLQCNPRSISTNLLISGDLYQFPLVN